MTFQMTSITGLICYDSYWEYMDGNATLKTDPDVARVSEIMQTINSKITDNFTRRASQSCTFGSSYC